MSRGLSQSGITKYRDCPYAFYLHYKCNCEPMFYDTEAMDVGGIGHKSIEFYYKNHFSTDTNPEEILYYTYDKMKSLWDTSFSIENYQKIYRCLENHAIWEYQNISNGQTNKPIIEKKMNHCGYFGIADYIYLPKRKVIDFKTNKYASVSYNYRMQAYVYKVLFENEFDTKLKDYYLYFLYPNEWRKISYEKENQKKVGLETEILKNKILNGEFPKKPRYPTMCRNCEYKYYCFLTSKK